MASETSVLLGYLGETVPSDDQTCAEELSKFGGQPAHAEGSPGAAAANTEGEAECADTTQKEDAGDSSDWLEAAFGARTAEEGDSGAVERRKKRQPAATSSISADGGGRAVSADDELMPPCFLHVEAEPPDNSRDDATGTCDAVRMCHKLTEQWLAAAWRFSPVGLQHPPQMPPRFLLQVSVPVSFSLNTSSGVALGVWCACSTGSSGDQEAYEESPDKVFLKLQKRLSRSPTQVVRYSFGGKPLFISPLSEEEARSVGHCPLCRSERVFEMQLVPMAADEISKRRGGSTADSPIDWGVVAVFTCKEDCIPPSNYTFEHVIVQEIL
ncbi:hypothetical protein Emed_003859 [Eimeria media]